MSVDVDTLTNAITGFIVGMIVGIIPSFHINNLAGAMFNIYLTHEVNLYYVLLFSSLSFTIFSFLSVVFYKTPSENELYIPFIMRYLSVKGIERFAYLSYLGFSFSTLFIILFLPLIVVYGKEIYFFILPHLPLILSVFIFIYFYVHRNPRYFLIGGCASLLGYVVMNNLNFNEYYALLPLFVGFYGLPYLLLSFSSSSTQTTSKGDSIPLTFRDVAIYSFVGFLCSLFAVFIPTIPPIFFLSYIPFINHQRYTPLIISLASMSYADNILSVLSKDVIGNSRSGVGIVLSAMDIITIKDVLLMLVFSSAYIFVSYHIFKKIVSSKTIKYLTSDIARVCVFIFLLLFVFYTTGILGIMVLGVSTFLGFACIKMNLTPTVLMFSIIFPLWFSFVF